jgi:hypothetical protein
MGCGDSQDLGVIMKKTLCETCKYGLIRELDCEDDACKKRHFINKCLFGKDYVDIITSCNRYKKSDGKMTYHDPDFEGYLRDAVKSEKTKEHHKSIMDLSSWLMDFDHPDDCKVEGKIIVTKPDGMLNVWEE